MVYFLLLLLSMATMLHAQDAAISAKEPDLAQYETVDRIEVTIFFGENDVIIITQADLQRPNLDGSTRTLEDLIFENLVYLDAKRYGMLASVESGERYFKMLQQANNRSQEELKKVFEDAGYTYEDALIHLARLSIINEMLDFRIRSRLIVPEKEVLAYYKDNPVIDPVGYLVERIFIPYPTAPIKNMAMYKKVLRDHVKQGKMPDADRVEFWVKQNELAEDKQFIAQLSDGELSQVQELEDGFELFLLKETRPERLLTLEERRLDIIRQLTQPRYEKLFNQYKESLRENATIVYHK